MKAVAGLKMSYQVQQAINGSKDVVIRGYRHDDSDSALCSHLYTMVRGNRQHRRAFLISLLNLFDDSSVSTRPSFMQNIFSVFSNKYRNDFLVLFWLFSLTESRGEHAAVYSRQLGLLPVPNPG